MNFRCKPFWYEANPEPVTITQSTGTITNPSSVYSEPIITVNGTGEITLMVGQTIVELSDITDSITLDSELQEAYSGSQSMNACMSGDFPILKPGLNGISWTGDVSSVTIRPNWRYL